MAAQRRKKLIEASVVGENGFSLSSSQTLSVTNSNVQFALMKLFSLIQGINRGWIPFRGWAFLAVLLFRQGVMVIVSDIRKHSKIQGLFEVDVANLGRTVIRLYLDKLLQQ